MKFISVMLEMKRIENKTEGCIGTVQYIDL